jgi:hypothetical protein
MKLILNKHPERSDSGQGISLLLQIAALRHPMLLYKRNDLFLCHLIDIEYLAILFYLSLVFLELIALLR